VTKKGVGEKKYIKRYRGSRGISRVGEDVKREEEKGRRLHFQHHVRREKRVSVGS